MLLRQALAAPAAGDDAGPLELVPDVAALGRLGGRRPREASPRPVAGRAERPFQRPRPAHEHPARPPHVARDDHWLPYLAIPLGDVMMARRKRPRRPLAVHADLLRGARHRVRLELRDVVGHVVEERHAERVPRLPEDPLEDLADLPHQKLAIAEGVVGRGPHRAQIRRAFGALDGRADQLPIGQLDPVLRRCIP